MLRSNLAPLIGSQSSALYFGRAKRPLRLALALTASEVPGRWERGGGKHPPETPIRSTVRAAERALKQLPAFQAPQRKVRFSLAMSARGPNRTLMLGVNAAPQLPRSRHWKLSAISNRLKQILRGNRRR